MNVIGEGGINISRILSPYYVNDRYASTPIQSFREKHLTIFYGIFAMLLQI